MQNIDAIEKICSEALFSIENSNNQKMLENIRIQYLGKKGVLSKYINTFMKVPHANKNEIGKSFNLSKVKIKIAILNRKILLNKLEIEKKIMLEKIDVTIPSIGQTIGSLHPISISTQRIEQIFHQMGFVIEKGNEIEDEYHNFSALNIPEYHPARTTHDTFYFNAEHVLRTHTSGVQIRTMENNKPPIRMISHGNVYRCDSDITHTPMFHQVEGLWIDKEINFSNLKGILSHFLQMFFESKLKIRFRPSYFPFTEPSAEIDIQCVICKNTKGCRSCNYTGWLEILGCGMVHPKVLNNNKIDSEVYRGFAFGIGIERLTMLLYGINDIRLFFENDIRFLQQFYG